MTDMAITARTPWADSYHDTQTTSCWRCGHQCYRAMQGVSLCADCRWVLRCEARDCQKPTDERGGV